MYRVMELIGMPVLSLDDGKQIGEVHDLTVDIGKAALCGLIVGAGSWFTELRSMVFADIFRMGTDAIMLRDASCLQPVSSEEQDGCCRAQALAGKTVYTETGLYLGTLTDIFLQPLTGELKGYELSDGLIADFLFGRKAMPLPPAQVVHSNRLLVPESMAQLLHGE
ncbi:MAG: PRC-barrel domain-containing protein [Sporomusaceae bacterium]|nr:PRC-barrel domain-containing protein [Sporomusaceae bacterium]